MSKQPLTRLSTRFALLVMLLLTLPASEAPARRNKPGAESPAASLAKADTVIQARLSATYGQLPLSFEANQGQTDPQAKFLSRGSGYSLYLTPTEAVLALRHAADNREPEQAQTRPGKAARAPSLSIPPSSPSIPRSAFRTPPSALPTADSAVLRMKLVGANRQPQVEGLEELPGKSNYFLGNYPKRWRAPTSPLMAR